MKHLPKFLIFIWVFTHFWVASSYHYAGFYFEFMTLFRHKLEFEKTQTRTLPTRREVVFFILNSTGLELEKNRLVPSLLSRRVVCQLFVCVKEK